MEVEEEVTEGGFGKLLDAVLENNLPEVKEILEIEDKSELAQKNRTFLINEKSWNDWR